jgi:hypothetical protein
MEDDSGFALRYSIVHNQKRRLRRVSDLRELEQIAPRHVLLRGS